MVTYIVASKARSSYLAEVSFTIEQNYTGPSLGGVLGKELS